MKEPAGSPESTIADRAMPAVKSGEIADQQVELHYQRISGHWCCGTTKLADLHTGQELQHIISALESVREGQSKQAIIPIDNGQFKSVFVLEVEKGLIVNRALSVSASDHKNFRGSLQNAMLRVGIPDQPDLSGPILLSNGVDIKSLQSALEKTDSRLEVTQSDNLISEKHLLPGHPGLNQYNYENPLSDFMPVAQAQLNSALVAQQDVQVSEDKVSGPELSDSPTVLARSAQDAVILPILLENHSPRGVNQLLKSQSPKLVAADRDREQSVQKDEQRKSGPTVRIPAEPIKAGPILAEMSQADARLSLAEQIVAQEQFERSIHGHTLAEVSCGRRRPQSERTVAGETAKPRVTAKPSVIFRPGRTNGIEQTISINPSSQRPEISPKATNVGDPVRSAGGVPSGFSTSKVITSGSSKEDSRKGAAAEEGKGVGAQTRAKVQTSPTQQTVVREDYDRSAYNYRSSEKSSSHEKSVSGDSGSWAGKPTGVLLSSARSNSPDEIDFSVQNKPDKYQKSEHSLNQTQPLNSLRGEPANSRDRPVNYAVQTKNRQANLRRGPQQNKLQPDSQTHRRAGHLNAEVGLAGAEGTHGAQSTTRAQQARGPADVQKLLLKNLIDRALQRLPTKSQLLVQLNLRLARGGDRISKLAELMQTSGGQSDSPVRTRALREPPKSVGTAQSGTYAAIKEGGSNNKAELPGSKHALGVIGEALVGTSGNVATLTRIKNQLEVTLRGSRESFVMFIGSMRLTNWRPQRSTAKTEHLRPEKKITGKPSSQRLAGDYPLTTAESPSLRPLAKELVRIQSDVTTSRFKSRLNLQTSEHFLSNPERELTRVAELIERLPSGRIRKLNPVGKRGPSNQRPLREALILAQEKLINELPDQTTLKFNAAFKKFNASGFVTPRFMISVIKDLRLSAAERAQLFCLIRINKLLTPGQPYRPAIAELRTAVKDAVVDSGGGVNLYKQLKGLIGLVRQARLVFSKLRQTGFEVTRADSQDKKESSRLRQLISAVIDPVKDKLPGALGNTAAIFPQSKHGEPASLNRTSPRDLRSQIRGSEPDKMASEFSDFVRPFLARLRNSSSVLGRTLRQVGRPKHPNVSVGKVSSSVVPGKVIVPRSELRLSVAEAAKAAAIKTETSQSEIDQDDAGAAISAMHLSGQETVRPENQSHANSQLIENLSAVKETLENLQSGALTEQMLTALSNLIQENVANNPSSGLTLKNDPRLLRRLRRLVAKDLDSHVIIQLMITSLILCANGDQDELKLLLREFSSFERYLLTRDLSSSARSGAKLKELVAVLKANKHSFSACLEQIR